MTHPMDSVPMPEPAVHQFQDKAGDWCNFINESHYKNTVNDGRWPIRALHTADQLRAERLSAYEMGRNAGLEEAALKGGRIFDPISWGGFNAAANPAKVIELLDRIDRLEAENEAKNKLLVQVKNRALAIIEAPKDTWSDGKAMKEMLREATHINVAITQHLEKTP